MHLDSVIWYLLFYLYLLVWERGCGAVAAPVRSNGEVLRGAQLAKCAAKDVQTFLQNKGRWVKGHKYTAAYDASACSYMQKKFMCTKKRTERIGTYRWKQDLEDSGCQNVDFAHKVSADADADFLQCTSNRSLLFLGDSNTRNSFVGFICRFKDYFGKYSPSSKLSIEDEYAASDPFYSGKSIFRADNSFSLGYSILYFNSLYDRAPEKQHLPAETILEDPLDRFFPKKPVDTVVINIGIHLYNACYLNPKIPRKDKFKCIQNMYKFNIKRFLIRIIKEKRAKKIIWRSTYPQRLPSSNKFQIDESLGQGAIESANPLPLKPTEKVYGHKLAHAWHYEVDTLCRVEIETLRSKELRDIGVEILDVSSMMALRTDAHTQVLQDRHSEVHTCLPGPIDDVNSLILNSMCNTASTFRTKV